MSGVLENKVISEVIERSCSRRLETAAIEIAEYFVLIIGTTAQAAEITDHLWDVNDLVALWESYEANQIAA